MHTPPFTVSYRYAWFCISNDRTKICNDKRPKTDEKRKRGKQEETKRKRREERKSGKGKEENNRKERGKTQETNEDRGKKVERKGGKLLSVVRDYFSNKSVSLRYR